MRQAGRRVQARAALTSAPVGATSRPPYLGPKEKAGTLSWPAFSFASHPHFASTSRTAARAVRSAAIAALSAISLMQLREGTAPSTAA